MMKWNYMLVEKYGSGKRSIEPRPFDFRCDGGLAYVHMLHARILRHGTIVLGDGQEVEVPYPDSDEDAPSFRSCNSSVGGQPLVGFKPFRVFTSDSQAD